MIHSSSRHLNILIMYPDPIVSAGLAAALRQCENFDIFVQGVDDTVSIEPPIDVVISDYGHAMLLTNVDARRMFGRLSESRVLALTTNDREADIRRAIQAGIHGYLLLGGSLEELVEGIATVGSGVRYLCSTVARRMADSLAGVTLTHRENEVLRLVASGQSNKCIARQLTIELGTVKSHVSSIMAKLGAVSRTQAASIAVTRGLVDDCQPVSALPSYMTRAHAGDAQPQFA